MYRLAELLKRAVLLTAAAFTLCIAPARAQDTHVTQSGGQATIFQNQPESAFTGTRVFIVGASPNQSMNLAFVPIVSGFGTGTIQILCTYDPTVPNYSLNTQEWSNVAFAGNPTGSNAYVKGPVTLSNSGSNMSVMSVGPLGCAQYAIVMIGFANSPTVFGSMYASFVNGGPQIQVTSDGVTMSGIASAGSPPSNSSGGVNVPPSPIVIGGISPSNTLLPARTDSSGNLSVDVVGSAPPTTQLAWTATNRNSSYFQSTFSMLADVTSWNLTGNVSTGVTGTPVTTKASPSGNITLHTVVVGDPGTGWSIDVYEGNSSCTSKIQEIVTILPVVPQTFVLDASVMAVNDNICFTTTGTAAGNFGFTYSQ